jgi:two-component system, response regulator PdtaR
MSKTYRVAVVDSEPSARQALHNLLVGLGHHVTLTVGSISQLEYSSTANVDLLIYDVDSDENWELVNQLLSIVPETPLIIATSTVDIVFLESKIADRVFGVVLAPIREAELAATIVVAVQRFHEFQQLKQEAISLRTALDDRKVIEQAKGVIMKKLGMDESGAFRHLQSFARQHRQKIVDVAKGILIAESAFGSIRINPDPALPTELETGEV